MLGGYCNHVRARGDGELDGEGTDGRAGAVDDEGLAGLRRGGRGVLQTQEALLARAVETCGGGVDGEGKNDSLAVAGALGDLCSDGSRGGGVELESSVLGVLSDQGSAVAKDTVTFGKMLHVASNLDDLAGNVAADDNWPVLDEHARVLDLPVDWVDSNSVVLDDDLVGGGIGHVRIGDAELLVLAIEVCCLVGHCGWWCRVL